MLASAALAASQPPRLRTVRDLLEDNPKQPLHFVYIHGIRASSPGFSDDLRKSVCKRMAKGCADVAATRRYLDLGDQPGLSYVGQPVWKDDAAWQASRPFVEHFVFERDGGGQTIVDEINYWPLFLPIKCRFLVAPDAPLTGPDKADLRICANLDNRPYLHAWIDPAEATRIMNTPARSGGGALINRTLKMSILSWGLSDAVITLGPMKYSTRFAITCAFQEIEDFDAKSAASRGDPTPYDCRHASSPAPSDATQFVVISESLGSFALLDAFAYATYKSKPLRGASTPGAFKAGGDEGVALQEIVARSDNIYFFANQFALLELARLEQMRSSSEPDGSGALVSNTLRTWASSGGGKTGTKQLVAFNDPSDILTYNVPDFCQQQRAGQPCGGAFTNIEVRNSFRWFGLFERPERAHTWYSRNRKVIEIILGK